MANGNDDRPESVGAELLHVDFRQLVGGMAQGIADAQLRLDMASMQVAQMMSGQDYEALVVDEAGRFVVGENGLPISQPKKGVKVSFGKKEGGYSLLELGFTPTFYQFVDTIIEVKISVNITREDTTSTSATNVAGGVRAGWKPFVGVEANFQVSAVSASFASKYQYSAEGSSILRTKLVPVPPPAILEERIRALLASET